MVEETTVTAAAPVDAPAPTPAPAPAPVAETKASPLSSPTLDSELGAIFDKHNQPRAEDGKFAAREGKETPAEAAPVEGAPADTNSDQKPEAPAIEQVKPAIDPPASWSADVKAKWASLPPDVQDYVQRRESEQHKAITQLGQQAKALEPLRGVLEQNADVFTRNGVSQDEGVARLLNAQRALDRDPASAIKQIADAYGVNLVDIGLGNADTASAVPPALQARLDQLERHNQQLEHRLSGYVSTQEQTQLSSLERIIDDFKKGKDDWATVENDVAAQIVAIKASNPGLPHADILAKAYENAVRINPEASKARAAKEAAELKQRAEAEAAKKAAEAKRLAGINVKSGPVNGATPKSIDDTLNEIASRRFGR